MSEERIVNCSKYKSPLPGLTRPPFKGDIGEMIFQNVSAKAWAEWKDMEIKVLNEYRLVLADPAQYKQLVDTMLSFLGLGSGDSAVPEVGDAVRGGGSRGEN
jgi:Fe-S cluster biosynthesis and repair protein YggX